MVSPVPCAQNDAAHDQRGQHPEVRTARGVVITGVTEQVDQPDDAEHDGETQAEEARHRADPPLPVEDVENGDDADEDREKHRLPVYG
jgi:hypothetical protein